MEWVNITAKTVEEATELALDNLGVDESEAEIEVLESPKQGLFGRTRGSARVRARVKPKTSRPKVERGRNRKRRPEAAGSGGARRSGGGRSTVATETESEQEDPVTVSSEVEANVNGAAESSNGAGRNKPARSGRRRTSTSDRHEVSSTEEASVEQVSEHLEVFLSGLSTAFGFDGSVTVRGDSDEGLLAVVDGKHGLMVGPRGRTLDAIQELARVSAQRTTPSNIRIKVDVGGYRDIRRDALIAFAGEVADAAVADGKERSLEPMSSADRKVVHDALSENADVETRSAGNEPNRRVVVVPLIEVGASDLDDVSDEVEIDEVEDTTEVEAEAEVDEVEASDDEIESVSEDTDEVESAEAEAEAEATDDVEAEAEAGEDDVEPAAVEAAEESAKPVDAAGKPVDAEAVGG